MRTRSEIENIVTNTWQGFERQTKTIDALLEIMMDIREALLDPVGATNAYNLATKDYAETLIKVVEMQKVEEAQPIGHPVPWKDPKT